MRLQATLVLLLLVPSLAGCLNQEFFVSVKFTETPSDAGIIHWENVSLDDEALDAVDDMLQTTAAELQASTGERRHASTLTEVSERHMDAIIAALQSERQRQTGNTTTPPMFEILYDGDHYQVTFVSSHNDW